MMLPENFSILVIEDDHVDQENLQRTLKKLNFNVKLHFVDDGFEALKWLRKEEFSLVKPPIILLDINMPRMEGHEFLQTIRTDPALHHLCVFVLTSSDQAEDIKMAYNHCVAGYIRKPNNHNQYVKTIKILTDYWSIMEIS